MPLPLFVISGCAAAGLGRTATWVSELGAPCGHERIFHPLAFQAGGALFWPPNYSGDASWFAAPVLSKLPAGSVVLHQLRDPLTTIQELVDEAFFDSEEEDRYFVQDFLPETQDGPHVERCMRFWLEWNRMIEAAEQDDALLYHRFQAEDLAPQRVVELTAALGVPRSAAAAGLVMEELEDAPVAPRGEGLRWSHLPSGELRDELMVAARRYGYVA